MITHKIAYIFQRLNDIIKISHSVYWILSAVFRFFISVAMTAHSSSSLTKYGIIKFDNIAFSVGMYNQSTYKSTGKFVCESQGLYIFSVSIYSSTNGAYFSIYLNGNRISHTWIGYNSNNPSSMRYTGTAVHSLQLNLNDSVWVYYDGTYHVESGVWSTFTIAKIK